MGLIIWFKSLFSKFIKKFKAFIEAAIPAVKQIVMAQLQDVAVNSVARLRVTDLNNEEKRNQAFKEIKDYALQKGVVVKDSLIFTLIELAYQYVKDNE